MLAVRAAYWPYRAASAPPAARPDAAGAGAYVETVRQAFLGPACVQAAFGPADERLAAAWHGADVPLATVLHAILLGCVRKSMSLLDRPAAQPVRSLRYFEPLLREVERERFPDAYWQHLEFNLGRCEDYWRHKPDTAPGRARPNLEQASSRSKAEASLPRPSEHERKDRDDDEDHPSPAIRGST